MGTMGPPDFRPADETRRAVEATIQRAVAEIKKRGVESDYCPRCNAFDWDVDLIEIPVKSQMTIVHLSVGGGYYPTGESTLPTLSIVCRRCGYTILHNLNVLGISVR